MVSILHAYYLFRHEILKNLPIVSPTISRNTLELDEVLSPFILSNEMYSKLQSSMDDMATKGMLPDQCEQSSLRMFPTYVRALPNGSETGNYLALDLGGTNFRVLLVSLKGQTVSMQNQIFPISQEMMKGPGENLFNHIVDCIATFLASHGIDGHNRIPLGFTFSFPCSQESLNVGRLVTWTKGFNCSGVVGEDVVRLLHDAINRREDIDVECVAILNDTVGCLMSCAFIDHNTEIAVILGTGTNACYMEKLDNVKTWKGDDNEPRQVIINMEWGAFGDKGGLDCIRTAEDREIDTESINPGKQIYEKMISGMYMGEVARLIIVNCVKKGLLLKGNLTDTLNTKYRFHTKYISEIDIDTEEDGYKNCITILEELGYTDPCTEDLQAIYKICRVVAERSAYLASSGIAMLLNRIEKPSVTVAVDGSLYRFHPRFHDLMMAKIRDLTKPELKFKLMLSEDGSGKGAALVAAVAARK